MKHVPYVGVAVAVMLSGSILTACASDNSGKTDAAKTRATSSTATAQAPTGTPITLLMTASKNNPGYAQHQLFAAADARVKSINAAGGLNGHPLKLIQCDSNLDPNQEAACVQQAVDEKVSAVVSSSILFTSPASLEKAGIPTVGSAAFVPNQINSPIFFGFPETVGSQGMAATAVTDGAKKVSVIYTDSSGGAFQKDLIDQILKRAGVDTVSEVPSALVSSDRSAEAATAMSKGPDAIIIAQSAEGTLPLIQSLRSAGYTGEIYTVSLSMNPDSIKTLGSQGDGVKVVGLARFVSDTANEKVAAFLADMKTYAPGEALDEQSAQGWSGVDLFATVMAHAESFKASDVKAAFDALTTPVEAGLFGPFVGAGKSCVPGFPGARNPNYIVGTVTGGKIVADGGFKSLCDSF